MMILMLIGGELFLACWVGCLLIGASSPNPLRVRLPWQDQAGLLQRTRSITPGERLGSAPVASDRRGWEVAPSQSIPAEPVCCAHGGSPQSARDAPEGADATNHTKSRCFSALSHELNTPLNAILGFSEMLDLGLAGTLDPRQREYVKFIHQSGQRLREVICGILDSTYLDHDSLIETPEEKASIRLFDERLTLAGTQPPKEMVLSTWGAEKARQSYGLSTASQGDSDFTAS
jgi:signal transduction histidine kinase